MHTFLVAALDSTAALFAGWLTVRLACALVALWRAHRQPVRMGTRPTFGAGTSEIWR